MLSFSVFTSASEKAQQGVYSLLVQVDNKINQNAKSDNKQPLTREHPRPRPRASRITYRILVCCCCTVLLHLVCMMYICMIGQDSEPTSDSRSIVLCNNCLRLHIHTCEVSLQPSVANHLLVRSNPFSAFYSGIAVQNYILYEPDLQSTLLMDYSYVCTSIYASCKQTAHTMAMT